MLKDKKTTYSVSESKGSSSSSWIGFLPLAMSRDVPPVPLVLELEASEVGQENCGASLFPGSKCKGPVDEVAQEIASNRVVKNLLILLSLSIYLGESQE